MLGGKVSAVYCFGKGSVQQAAQVEKEQEPLKEASTQPKQLYSVALREA